PTRSAPPPDREPRGRVGQAAGDGVVRRRGGGGRAPRTGREGLAGNVTGTGPLSRRRGAHRRAAVIWGGIGPQITAGGSRGTGGSTLQELTPPMAGSTLAARLRVPRRRGVPRVSATKPRPRDGSRT